MPPPIPLLDLTEQYQSLKPALDAAIAKTVTTQQFTLGPEVAAFEEEIAAYLGVHHALGVASGTDALLMSLMAKGIGPGDEVITSSFSFFATAEVIAFLGAKPVFVDIDEATFNLRPDLAEKAITPRTKAIILVHLFGGPADAEAFQAIAKHHNLTLIEDCAQAIGTRWKGKKAGAFGQLGAYSFFPSKNLGAFGDGGLVVTNDHELATILKEIRVHGMNGRYTHKRIGLTARLDALQAAVLRVKLPYLDGWNEARRTNAAHYRQSLSGLPIRLPHEAHGGFHTYHQFSILTSERDTLQKHLSEQGVGSGVYYPMPIHLQEAMAYLGYGPGSLPVTERCAQEVLSLPIYPELGQERLFRVSAAVRAFFEN